MKEVNENGELTGSEQMVVVPKDTQNKQQKYDTNAATALLDVIPAHPPNQSRIEAQLEEDGTLLLSLDTTPANSQSSNVSEEQLKMTLKALPPGTLHDEESQSPSFVSSIREDLEAKIASSQHKPRQRKERVCFVTSDQSMKMLKERHDKKLEVAQSKIDRQAAKEREQKEKAEQHYRELYSKLAAEAARSCSRFNQETDEQFQKRFQKHLEALMQEKVAEAMDESKNTSERAEGKQCSRATAKSSKMITRPSTSSATPQPAADEPSTSTAGQLSYADNSSAVCVEAPAKDDIPALLTTHGIDVPMDDADDVMTQYVGASQEHDNNDVQEDDANDEHEDDDDKVDDTEPHSTPQNSQSMTVRSFYGNQGIPDFVRKNLTPPVKPFARSDLKWTPPRNQMQHLRRIRDEKLKIHQDSDAEEVSIPSGTHDTFNFPKCFQLFSIHFHS